MPVEDQVGEDAPSCALSKYKGVHKLAKILGAKEWSWVKGYKSIVGEI